MCALELAILDAYGRRFGESLGPSRRAGAGPAVCARFGKARGVRYSGAITAESARAERISAWKMRIYGFRQVKIKVGTKGQDDPARLAQLQKDPRQAHGYPARRERSLARQLNCSIACSRSCDSTRPPSSSPCRTPRSNCLAELRPRLGIPVMLDESLCGYPDAVAAIESRTADLLNVRLSKCGRNLALTPDHRAGTDARDLGVQLGCHPGETSLLSAAGRHVGRDVSPVFAMLKARTTGISSGRT